MAEQDPVTGQLINGKYLVLGSIARGGMGMVYEADQVALHRRVALKVLLRDPTHSQRDPAFRERFFREASLSAKIHHPNVVTVFDYGPVEGPSIADLEGGYFIAMEYLPGETLRDRLKRDGALSPMDAVRVVSGVARGVREAHRLGLIHRDLKPGNVMLVPQEDGEWVKVLDFGLVKQVDSDEVQELTSEGTFLGSPRFISPEQVMGGTVDARSDIYSLGVILYQCLCGQVPFAAETTVQTMMARVSGEAPSMATRVPGFQTHPELDALVMRMIARAQEARPRDLTEVLRSLRAVQLAMGVPADALTATGENSAPFGAAPLAPFMPGDAAVAAGVGDISQPSAVHSLAAATRTATLTVPARPPPPRSKGLVVGGVLALTLVAAGAVYSLVGASDPRVATAGQASSPRAAAVGRPASVPQTPQVPRAVSPVVSPGVSPVVSPVVSPLVHPVTATPPAVPVVAPAVAAPVGVPAGIGSHAPGPVPQPAEPVQATNATGDHGDPRHPSRSHHLGAVQASAVVPAPSPGAPAPAAPVAAPAPTQDGFLSIDTTPWTRVYADGHDLGVTPLQHVALSPGDHRLQLRNPDLGVNTGVTVTIRPGETTARRLGLE